MKVKILKEQTLTDIEMVNGKFTFLDVEWVPLDTGFDPKNHKLSGDLQLMSFGIVSGYFLSERSDGRFDFAPVNLPSQRYPMFRLGIETTPLWRRVPKPPPGREQDCVLIEFVNRVEDTAAQHVQSIGAHYSWNGSEWSHVSEHIDDGQLTKTVTPGYRDLVREVSGWLLVVGQHVVSPLSEEGREL